MPVRLVLTLFLMALGLSAPAAELKAGAAKVEITPPTGFPMWGYAARHDEPSQGVLDPLYARALVLAADDQKIALVSLDLGRAPTRSSMETIRAKLKDAGLDRVFLVGSHTHHGPILELDNWPTPKTSYIRSLEQKLVDLILEADKNLKPAKVGAAAGQTQLNRNRHSKREDAPVDRDLRVLRIETTEGEPIALAVNFAAHATMLDSKMMKFSADYPGVMVGLIEKETSVPCLFLQGAAGDLSPNRDKGPADKFGQALGREALDLLKNIRCAGPDKAALKVKDEDFQFPMRIKFTNPFVKAALAQAFFPELIGFFEREYKEGVRPHLSTALLTVGDQEIGFVGVSGEFFCGHALSLKKRARLDHLFFLGYCNDYHQYFPTIEAATEGGYGTEPYIGVAEIGSGERVMDAALLNLYRMRGKLLEVPGK